MDNHVKEFYCQASDGAPKGNFFKVISLGEDKSITWEAIKSLTPNLCKGWFELSSLPKRDRIEFTRDFWLSKLPYHPHSLENISSFFDSLDDIHVFIVQKKFDDPYEAHLVYCVKNDNGFYHGNIGIEEKDLIELQTLTKSHILPQDYLAFLQIHNGFSKSTDTGIIPTYLMIDTYNRFQEMLSVAPIVTGSGNIVDPTTLIPFYESFGMPFFQCFWTEWYPAEEVGNVYYSGVTHTISEIDTDLSSTENMAFFTFLDWLFFYLEKIE